MTLKILELFGGVGACSKALKRLGIDFEVVDYVEIDKKAVASYNAINETNFEPQDICKWNKDLNVDLIMHGSPCQNFSKAGDQKGGNKGSGTQSSLMYETIRIVKKLKPKYVVWENVRNLISKRHRHNFDAYLETMEQLGYKNYYQVLNAKDYGIPQNRERVFTISILNGEDFVFPKKQILKAKLSDFLDKNIEEKYYINSLKMEQILFDDKYIGNCLKIKNATKKGHLLAYPGDGINISSRIRYQRGNVQPQSIQTITTSGGNERAILLENLKIKKLSPRECWRLMGFDDEDFEKVSKINSNTSLYKQAGNSIVVNILEAIFKELIGD